MQATAMIIKVLSVGLQYGMLFFLLYFVYKAVRFMAKMLSRWWRISTQNPR